MLPLAHYRAKRDFKLTPEPRGRLGAKKVKARAYVIQKHAASHLHYDFRLELNGVLLSWAVPKGPSLDPADKRLAMHVEDHPLEYGGFEGTIPKGQYGGGTVMLWDRGTWSPIGDAEEGYRRGHLKFELNGEKLKGRWALIKTHGTKYGGKGEPWLLIKDNDSFVRRGVDARVVDDQPNSVLSERSIDQIAAAGDHEWHSNRSVKANIRAGAVADQTPARRKLEPLEQKSAPFANPPRGFEAKGAHWVAPKLVAEVQFTEWSEGGALRHPAFVGLREDKKATEVVREKSVALEAEKPAPAAAATRRSPKRAPAEGKESDSDSVAGVKLSHPDKLLFPEAKLTKLALARYYESVADWIVPHVQNRPLSLFRCPDGWNKQCFYQKHAEQSVHASVKRVAVPEGGGTATYFSAGSLQALVGLVQWGVIELHPWGSRMPHPEKPDRLIFDFDPGEDVSWPQLVKAVNELRTLLKRLGLVGFLKTTGGKGLHVVVPIKATLTWEQAKGFTKAIADLFARTFPDRFTATVSKSKRKGRIFIDYLRNAEGATAIAAYGIRARKNAPVSTPVSWKELDKDVRFDFFNVKTVPLRLSKLREDPWKDFSATRQMVSAAMFKRVGMRG